MKDLKLGMQMGYWGAGPDPAHGLGGPRSRAPGL